MSQHAAHLVTCYEDAVASGQRPRVCAMCNRPLADAQSVALGIDPDCRQKYGALNVQGTAAVVEQAMALAPAAMRDSITPLLRDGDNCGAVTAAIWHAAMAVSYAGPGWRTVVVAAQKLAEGCGSSATAARLKHFYAESAKTGSAIRIERLGSVVCARAPFNRTFIDAVKKIEGRRWDGQERAWSVPRGKLAQLHAALNEAFSGRFMVDLEGGLCLVSPEPRQPPPQAVRAVPPEAFPYQVEGISWLDQKGSGLLSDEPGLGKTLQACVAADPPVVVVCPAAMRVEWAREMGKWRSDLSTLIVTGKKALAAPKYRSADVIIINYDILVPHTKPLLQLGIKTLIADEAHYLKTLRLSRKKYAGSNRSKAFVELAASSDRLFLLTATPIMNRPIELWPLLHFLDPVRWDSYSDFGKRYCDGKLEQRIVRGGKRVTTWDFTGSSNGAELNAILTAQYMLRRTKDVLDLPPKSRQTKLIALDAKCARDYKRAAKDFEDWVHDQGGPQAVMKHRMAPALTKMTALRQLAAYGKVPYATEWIVNHFEATGRPLVVMGYHRGVTLGLKVALEERDVESPSGTRKLRVGLIIGGISDARRTAYKDSFQAGDLDVLVCSIPAAGAGLTLTAASETLFIERTWRPMDQVQAEDRIHRIGQENKCTITYLQAANTVDGVIAAMLVDKQATIAQRIDGLDLSDDEAKEYVFGRMFGLDIGVGSTDGNQDQRNFSFIEWQAADAF